MTAFTVPGTSTDWDIYNLFKAPTNPYNLYNNQDRFLNAVYRAFTTGELQNLYQKWNPEAVAGAFTRISFQYEKQTNLLSQHFWTTTALLGVGYSANNADFGSSDGNRVALATLATLRSAINATIETALQIGNAFRYSSQMQASSYVPSTKFSTFEIYETKVKYVRMSLGVGASIGFILNAMVAMGMASKQLDMAINSALSDPKRTEKIQIAAITLAASTANMGANFMKALSAYGSLAKVAGVTKYSASTNRAFGIAGSALGVANGALNIAALAPILARTDLTDEQRGIIIGEMTVQVAGAVTQAVCNFTLAINLAKGLTTGAAVIGPALGAAAAGLVLCLSPLQIYGLVKQNEYADKLDELGKEMAGYGYAGDSMLANLYREKTNAEGEILAVTTSLALAASAVSIAAAASVVGAPLAAFVGIATAIVSGILQGVQQPIIEEIANDYANKIKARGGAFIYFGKSLEANYAQLVRGVEAKDYVTSVQTDYGVDSVIGVSTVAMSSSARELAAITKNAADAQANKAYIDRFVNGEVKADRTISIDPGIGVINMVHGMRAGTKQLLTFLTPLMSPGTEQRIRVDQGKNSYITNLTIIGDAKAWTINDGASSSVMDISNIVTRVVDSNGNLKKEIGVVVNAGEGDDTLIAGASQTEYNGGTGNNSISYANFGGNSGIDVYVTDYGFKVIKNLKAVQTYEESIKSETVTYGKRSEAVQYREFTLVTKDIYAEDRLYNVSNIMGTEGDDTIRGNDANNVIAGGRGADNLYGNGGDDHFMQNLNLECDHLDGGSGNDTVDYSVSKFTNSQRDNMGSVGVWADLSAGKIYKYKGYNNGIYDTVSNIENVLGSTLNDILIGDDKNNILSGNDGNDTLYGGGGEDSLIGGVGADLLNGGSGDDKFAQNINLESDTLDGDDGNDTVDYGSLNTFANGVRDSMGNTGIWADLSAGKVYKYKGYNNGIYDTVRNIENVIGTTLNDTLLGDGKDNVLSGGDGNDRLGGGAGNDNLLGGLGADTLIGGDGDDRFSQNINWEYDTLDGGAGVNTADYSTMTTFVNGARDWMGSIGISADLAGGKIYKYKGYNYSVYDTVSHIQNVVGTSLNDTLMGDVSANILVGGDGHDSISGGSGDDTLTGDRGADRVEGGVGNDTLSGGAGADAVNGDEGDDYILQDMEAGVSDTLNGGAGSDMVDYSVTDLTQVNLITNGEFDSALTSADTEYVVDVVTSNRNGHVVVQTMAPDRRFQSRIGVTGASDKFLTVDGSPKANQLFWKQSVKLVSGAHYRFSYMVNGNYNPAQIQLSVDGQAVGAVTTVTASGGWQQVQVEFDATQSGLVQLGLKNLNLAGDGNDFLIDKLNLTLTSGTGIGIVADLANGTVQKFGNAASVDRLVGIENLVGTSWNDSLTGDANDNALSGGDGNDTLRGGDGDDFLLAGSGDDVVDGGAGNDTLSGGAGADSISGGDGNDTILQDLEAGVSDTLNGGAGNDVVDYSVTDLTQVNLITNGEFDSALTSADTEYVVDAFGSNGYVAVLTTAPDWRFQTRVGIHGADDKFLIVDGSTKANQLFWKQSVKLVSGTHYRFSYMVNGNDNPAQIQLSVDGQAVGAVTTVTASGGWQQVQVEFDATKSGLVQLGLKNLNLAGDGNDFLVDKLSLTLTIGIVGDLSNGTVTKFGNSDGGADRLTDIESLIGTSLDDRLTGDVNNNGLSGGAGNDVVSGGLGNDTLAGGAGTDTVNGGEGDDYILQDMEVGVSDTLNGGAGNDVVDYSVTDLTQVNLITNGEFDSALTSADTEYVVDVVTSNRNGHVVVQTMAPDRRFQSRIGVTGASDKFLTVDGSTKANQLFWKQSVKLVSGAHYRFSYMVNGNYNPAQIQVSVDGQAVGAVTTVTASGGWQQVQVEFDATQSGWVQLGLKNLNLAGDGNDFLVDKLSLAFTTGIVGDLSSGTVTKFGNSDGSVDRLTSIEGLVGTLLNDRLTGNADDNLLNGMEGNDRLEGEAGDDVLIGGQGNDTLSGGVGNDHLSGGAGADSISGGDGNDTIIQDLEAGVSDTLNGGAGNDVVDYSVTDLTQVNLITNGEFDSALTSADTEYVVDVVTSNRNGHVVVQTMAPDRRFQSRIGVTGASDKFLTVDGSTKANQLFWKQSVQLVSGAHYRFSYMVNGNENPAQIQLSVEGQAVGAVTTVTASGGWQQVQVEFDATQSGWVQLGLKNLNLAGDGNDFLIDKLSLAFTMGIVGDLSSGTVQKFGNAASVDRLTDIESLVGTSLDDRLTGDVNNNSLSGGAGNDTLSGDAGKDILLGGDGNDLLNGGADNDILIGGAGSDTMSGDTGDDYFEQTMELTVSDIMDGGAGSDTVDYSSTGMLTGRYVMIHRNAGVTTALSPLSFTVLSNAQNGVKSMQSAEDGIWVQVDLGSFVPIDAISAQFASAPSAYSVYVGDADMRGLSATQIEARSDVTISRQTGTTNTLSLQAAGIVADLTQGTVTKRYGGFTTVADRISNIENVVGTLYNDTLIGDANDNTLSGGGGNDTLTGGAGNDVYLFGRGDGQDTVIDTDSTVLNIDVLVFKSGIAEDQLWFKHIGDDLEISIIDSADKVKIQNWYSGSPNQIERIVTFNRKILLNTDIEQLVQAMASFAVPVSGQTVLPTNYQATLAPVIAANWH